MIEIPNRDRHLWLDRSHGSSVLAAVAGVELVVASVLAALSPLRQAPKKSKLALLKAIKLTLKSFINFRSQISHLPIFANMCEILVKYCYSVSIRDRQTIIFGGR